MKKKNPNLIIHLKFQNEVTLNPKEEVGEKGKKTLDLSGIPSNSKQATSQTVKK